MIMTRSLLQAYFIILKYEEKIASSNEIKQRNIDRRDNITAKKFSA